MKRWDFEIGGLITAVLLVVAILLVIASMVGHLAQAFGLL